MRFSLCYLFRFLLQNIVFFCFVVENFDIMYVTTICVTSMISCSEKKGEKDNTKKKRAEKKKIIRVKVTALDMTSKEILKCVKGGALHQKYKIISHVPSPDFFFTLNPKFLSKLGIFLNKEQLFKTVKFLL